MKEKRTEKNNIVKRISRYYLSKFHKKKEQN
jgi:hypothetical protein